MEISGLHPPSLDHVYPVREDSLLLATSAHVRPGERVAEVGCGSGLASLAAARSGAQVVATDLNPYALAGLREESLRLGLSVHCVRTDLLSGLRSFHAILFNPPYLPTPPGERDADPWDALALDGGPDGQQTLWRFLASAPSHLLPGGRVYLLWARIRGQVPAESLPSTLGREGWNARNVGSRSLPAEELEVLELVRD